MHCLPVNSEDLKVHSIYMEKILIEDKVTFRKLTSEDLHYFYLWASDREVAKTMTWEAYTSISEAEKFLKDVVENHPWFKAVCLDGIPIGSITLNQGKGYSSCRAELGFVLAKKYWGKGIATVAVKKAIKMGFQDLDVSRIEALVDPDNIASQRVIVKAGMNCEGLLKSFILFKGNVKDRYIYAVEKK